MGNAEFQLCEHCFRRIAIGKRIKLVALASEEKSCFVCQGMLSSLQNLVQQALAAAQNLEWQTFSVSSSFPKSVFVREQRIADYLPPENFSSIKNSANAQLISQLSALSGKKNSQRFADIVFEIDFANGKANARALPIYIFGHYLKLSREVCQSRWHCPNCGGTGLLRLPKSSGKDCGECKGSGMNYPSVEDELGKVLTPAFGASGCSLHASGREDVDVRALGTGRPFVLELKNPKKRSADMRKLEQAFSANERVQVIGLKSVRPTFIDAVCNSHFDKEYSALVSADRPLSQKDADAVQRLSGTLLFQQTPKRVMARRADMVRKRQVHAISAECAPGGKLRLRIFAEAGTYIKELISSDGGRTKPSVSEILSCKATCDELDVVAIHDYFLETIAP
ncbi:MAG: tRNA pseudouridine(54/55) synthase Pus10 [Candidatus Anstonellaceae archaeon]